MKRALIGAAFFIGGAILISTGEGTLTLFGLITGFAGMIIMIFELNKR